MVEELLRLYRARVNALPYNPLIFYKKCSYEKDQVLLRDASPYEGVIMTQAQSSPGMIDRTDKMNDDFELA